MSDRVGYYDGARYARWIEPTVSGLHRLIAEAIPDDVSVIDFACGTGAFARRLAPRCQRVVGVDLSPRMIEYGRTQPGSERVDLRIGDASDLPDIEADSFDYATIVMGLHEMPSATRPRVIAEMTRVASTAILVDFVPRMRWNLAGMRNRLFEIGAGPRHFSGFRDFSRRGGLSPMIRDARLTVLRHGRVDAGNLDIYTVTADAERGAAPLGD